MGCPRQAHQCHRAGLSASYLYDASGRRARQTLNTVVTKYLWDERSMYGDVVAELNASNAVTVSYVLGNGQLISQKRGATTSYYLADAQNSTRLLTNTSAAVTDTYRYSAFGDIETQTGTTTNSYLYTGQQFDSSTGLYSLRARYYDAAVGRFLSRDTWAIDYQNPTELNRYIYAVGNPVRFSDPSGHFSFDYGWITDKVKALVAGPLAKFGLEAQLLFSKVYLWFLQTMPWLIKAVCVGAQFATQADISSACMFPDIPGPSISRAEPGNPISEAVAFVRWLAEKVLKIIPADRFFKNIAVARYNLRGVEEFLWGVSGRTFPETIVARLEDLLRRLGQFIAPSPGERRFIWTDAEFRAYDSEIKVLEELSNMIATQLSRGATLVVDLYTERRPCHSCGGDTGVEGVIGQFIRYWGERGISIIMNVTYDYESSGG